MKRPAAPLAIVAAVLWLPVASAAAQPERGSVQILADDLATRTLGALEGLGGDATVVIEASLPADAPAAGTLVDALVEPLTRVIAADPRFVSVGRAAADRSAEAAARRGAMRDTEAVVHVALSTRGNAIEARVTVFQASHGGLRDLFRPEPRVAGRFVLRHRLDAHLRRYLGALPRVDETRLVARSMPLPSSGYVAMAARDLDGDGRTELVLARPRGALVVRLGSTERGTLRAVPVGEATPEGLAPASSRARRTVGSAVPVERGVVVRTSEYAGPFVVRLSGSTVTAEPVNGPCPDAAYPLPDGCAERVAGRDWFESDLAPRPDVDALPDAPSGFYARAARWLPVPDGSWRAVDVVVTPRGRLGARADGRRGGAVGYGAALGLADLEDDGLAEVLASSPSAPGEPDRLSLLRVREDGSLIAVWTSEEMEGSVLLAGQGDLDDDGREELLAIEEPAPGVHAPARLWVVQ